ncbi:MAG: hypothetical protein PHI70_01020 [Proteiniphilum sp.]|nr:hypothetical protein [Proteiniphilum sp.]MDD4415360.1 hypothetical protein [Proteiniphilum sp.]
MPLTTLFKTLLLCAALSVSSLAYSQTDIDTLATRISERFSRHIPEMVYLQTSKGVYETGEDLWFKAYQFDAQTLNFSLRSQTLFLEMRGKNDTVVWQEKYPVENGLAQGQVYIDKNLPEGDYFLEAYTPYSFYADSTQFVSKRKIRVVRNVGGRAFVSDTATQKEVKNFALLPEGGSLVEGLPARLAFKATDGKGNPVEVSGTLFEDNNPLKLFSAQHAGMGAIDFTPRRGKTYRIELSDGTLHRLPEIHPEGISLRLAEQTPDYLLFTVWQSKNLPKQPFYLLGQQRGVICSIARGLTNDSLQVRIPLNDFMGQDIAQFTLFNHHMQPVAERLVYILPEKKLNITVTPDKQSYLTREKVTLNIKTTDETGKPVQANLGMSVFDEAYANPADPVNILTHCHLSSQLKGKIYDPAYYFDEENANRAEALNLLMLTQGWSRYVWDAATFIPHGAPLLTDGVTGVQSFVSDRKSKQVTQTEQLVQVSGADGNAEFVWTDSAGFFTVEPATLKELRGGYIYLKPMLGKEYTPQIHVHSLFPAIDSIRKIKPDNYPAIDVSQLTSNYVDNVPVVSSDSIILLNELTVTGTKGRPFRDKFMGRLDSLAQRNLNPAWVCECSPQYLNDYLPGYTHHPQGSARSGNYKRLPPEHGRFYRLIKYEPKEDGIWYVKDIKELEYRGPYYSDEELLRMNNIWREKGYYGKREFYHPDEADMLTSVPDARNTLFWAPDIVTDAKGEAAVSFFCSDINTVFNVYVEGVGENALLGIAKKEFRVLRDVK